MRDTARAADDLKKKIKRKNKDKKASPSQDFRKEMMQKKSTKANDSKKKIRSVQIGFPDSIPSNYSSESDYDDYHDESDFYDYDNNSNHNVAHHRTGNSTNGMRGGQRNDLSKSNKLTRYDRNDDNDNIGDKRMRSERGTGGDDRYDEIRRREGGKGKGRGGGIGRERGRERKERSIKGNSVNDGSRSIYPNAKKLKGQTESTHSKKRRAHMTIEDDKDNDGYGDGDENKNRGKRRGVFSSEALMNQRRGNIQYDFFQFIIK